MSVLAQIEGSLPQGNIRYPEQLLKKREILLEKYKEEKNNPNLRTKLILISQTLLMLKEQVLFENANKVKAMAIYERDRAVREGRLLVDGS